MPDPVVEIVYQLTEEDLLNHVRVKLKSWFKDPLVRTRVTYIAGYGMAFGGVCWTAWMLAVGVRKPNELWAGVYLTVVGALSGYRSHKAHRRFYEKVKKTASRLDWLVLRAYRTGFSITRPGISESSINWTSIKSVNLAPSYLYINTKDDMTYRVPTRFMSEEQWEALKTLLSEIWDMPGEQSGAR